MSKLLVNNHDSSFFDQKQKKEVIKNGSFAKEKLADLKWTRRLRIGFSIIIFLAVCVYMGFVLNIVYRCGNLFNGFYLNTTVLVTLLTTTTANILAILGFIVKFLFPQNRGKK